MASEIPFDRVRQLQADLWRLSGVSSYDPAGSSLPPLPPLTDAIAALDPDLPPSLRCGRCGGGLLRGLQSTLCIYCGADRRDEGFSYSISFNSTAACRKLLDFLELDGSETVLLDTESSGSNKGHDTPKSELVLSDLLDLELRWPSDKVDFDDNITITSRSPDEYALNLTGGDLDYFFSERKKDVLSVQEPNKELMLRKNTDAKVNISSGSENFAAFEKLLAKDAKVSTSSNLGEFPPITTEFAVWNSEFRPVTTQTTTIIPDSLDLFQDSSLDGLAHASRTAASVDQLENIEEFAGTGSKLGPSTSVNAMFENDFWPMDNAKIDALNLPKPETSDGTMNSVSNDISSRFIDHFTVQEDLWPANNSTESGISGQVNPKDDLFDDWQDFTCSTGAKGSSTNLGQETGLSLFGSETMPANLFPESDKTELQEKIPLDSISDPIVDWQDFTSFSPQDSSSVRTQTSLDVFEQSFKIKPVDMRSKVVPDSLGTVDVLHESSDVLKDFAGSSRAPEDSLNQRGQNVVTPYKDSLGTDSVDPWHTHNTKDFDKNKPLPGDNDSFVNWQDFTTFSEAVHRSANVGAPSGPTLLEKPSETKLEESANGHDDTFDDWQDFASSVGMQGSSSSPGEQSCASLFQNPPETNSVNQQGIKEDGPSDALKSQKHYHVEKNVQLDSLIFERSNEVDQAGVDPHPMIRDLKDTTASSNANSNSESEKTNVEKLTSKMHDLSFMLVDELSVPAKPTKG